MAAKHTGVVFAFLAVLLAGCGAYYGKPPLTATAYAASLATAPPNGALIATEIACPNGYRGRFEIVYDTNVRPERVGDRITLSGYRWVLVVTPPDTASLPGIFSLEAHAWGRREGFVLFVNNVPADVVMIGGVAHWRWTDAVRVPAPAGDTRLEAAYLWPQWEQTLSTNPYRVRYPVPLGLGQVEFDLREGPNGLAPIHPRLRSPATCGKAANAIYPDDFPKLVGK